MEIPAFVLGVLVGIFMLFMTIQNVHLKPCEQNLPRNVSCKLTAEPDYEQN